ncbi:hypothetical protein V500_05840 [Pseudogymnoascus sp. VKM F-4518 (FW-2643)]|nr:hypothetical protein V500_05840 [Pseudogymnoascus sp. VKM F-4518 (FW-2643)]
MNVAYPDDPASWKRMALRSGISTDLVLNDLKSLKKRPNAERHTRKDGTPRNKVISLSGSTARTDDGLILRAILKRGDHDSALDYLFDSKYADEKSWDKALECLGLQSVGKDLEPIAVTAESEGETPQRDIGTPAGSRRPAMAQETFRTPVQQKTEPGTPQIPQAPKKGASRERPRYVEGTEAFHRFMDALCPKTESHEFYKTAKLDVYGGFKFCLKSYETFKLWQMIGEAKNVLPSASILSNRPAGSDSPRATLQPLRRLVVKLRQARLRGWPESPTPRARSQRKGVEGILFPNNSSTAKQPIMDAGNEDKDEDEDEDEDEGGDEDEDEDEDEGGDEPRIPNLLAGGEMTIANFSCNFTIELFAMRSSLPAVQTLAMIPFTSEFCFGAKTSYAVNARIDGLVRKAGFEHSSTMSKSELARSHLLVAEFKAHKDLPIINQIIFEFSAIISTIYGEGGEDSSFEGRRYQLAIYQCGITLGIVLAAYTQSWVQYIQDGTRAVIPAEGLQDDEMLILRVLHNFNLGDTDGGYIYSALLRAVEVKETARLVV